MIYIDTSFLALTLLEQEFAERTIDYLQTATETEVLISSALLQVEVARLAHRTGLSLNEVNSVLDGIALLDIDDEIVNAASSLIEDLKSLDAIHLASALYIDSTADPVVFATHDRRLAEAAVSHGLEVKCWLS